MPQHVQPRPVSLQNRLDLYEKLVQRLEMLNWQVMDRLRLEPRQIRIVEQRGENRRLGFDPLGHRLQTALDGRRIVSLDQDHHVVLISEFLQVRQPALIVRRVGVQQVESARAKPEPAEGDEQGENGQ